MQQAVLAARNKIAEWMRDVLLQNARENRFASRMNVSIAFFR